MRDFITVLGSMSVQASIIILVVFILRMILKKLHVEKKYMMILWVLPFFFLLFPWKISVPNGFWQNAPVEMSYNKTGSDSEAGQKAKQTYAEKPQSVYLDTELKENNNVSGNMLDLANQDISKEDKKNSSQSGSADIKNIIGNTLSIIWTIGILTLLIWNIISYKKLNGKLLCSVKIDENVYQGDEIATPIVVGIVKPCIYVPSGLPEEYQKYVIAHEKTHIRRFDTIYKMIVYSITCIHWFNPVVWCAFYLFGKDMEMCCDEETVRILGMEEKELYAKALLGVASKKNVKSSIVFVAPIAFEEGNVKSRIKNIMKYRKTVSILAVTVVIACVLTTVIFITKEKTVKEELPVVSIKDQNIDAFNSYMSFIKQIEAAFNNDFNAVSTDELGISPAFNGGINMNMYNVGYQLTDMDTDGIQELLLVASSKYDSEKLIYDIYKYQKGKLVHTFTTYNDVPAVYASNSIDFFKFAVSQDPKDETSRETVSELPRETESTTPQIVYEDNDNLQFSDLEGMEFMFSSGAGAWSTVVTINSDGTFTGYYHDSDMGSDSELYPNGTRNECYFSGKFSTMTKNGAYEYYMKCEYLNIELPDVDVTIEDGVKIIPSDPYGFDNAEGFYLYLPGKSKEELPEEFLSWSHGKAQSGQLECYGLYNVGGEQGFIVW